ncbi:MAG: WXG100 family type VII secretion target [Culicoidibacterales bacterium]
MGLIKLTPDTLRTQSGVYGKSATEIEQMIGRLNTLQREISEGWDGVAWQAFENQYNDLVPKVEAFRQLLEDIERQLKEVARVVEQTDQDISNKLGFK